jgi:hypothetical protein
VTTAEKIHKVYENPFNFSNPRTPKASVINEAISSSPDEVMIPVRYEMRKIKKNKPDNINNELQSLLFIKLVIRVRQIKHVEKLRKFSCS